jgi:hypothetical protein
MAKRPSGTGISAPYKQKRALGKRITSSALKECVRAAIGEPHIDLTIKISRVYGGIDPPEQMYDEIRQYRKFIDDGMTNQGTGLKLSSVEDCDTLLDFEQKIEGWYTANGWVVVP